MKRFQKNWLLLNKCLVFLIALSGAQSKSQIGNYVSNGSFESLNSNSVTSLYNAVNYWQPIDTNKYADYLATMLPPISNVPYAQGYQYPRTGKSYVISTFYCPTCTGNARGYPRNRLKQNLRAGITYCAKYYVVNSNISPLGMDSYGIYFANSDIDTINYCNLPLTYLTPQIQYSGGIITDTLNWTVISGTFIATSNEKYMVLGNFRSNAATNTLLIDPTTTITPMAVEVCIDDVSCIEVNLPAYAGPDKVVIPGNSVFIGREPDFAIDPGCMWYKLPDMTTAIDTISGLWVSPTETTTYVVRQELDCSTVKWDTVVVHINGVGLEKLQFISQKLEVYPVPAKDYFKLKMPEAFQNDFNRLVIHNYLGDAVREEELAFKNGSVLIETSNLPDGVYLLQLKGNNSGTASKRVIISR